MFLKLPRCCAAVEGGESFSVKCEHRLVEWSARFRRRRGGYGRSRAAAKQQAEGR
jgi:hypothetical protein